MSRWWAVLAQLLLVGAAVGRGGAGLCGWGVWMGACGKVHAVGVANKLGRSVKHGNRMAGAYSKRRSLTLGLFHRT